MTLKIDSVGRIVVPKQIRERLGITTSSEIEVVYQADGVLLKAVSDDSAMTYKNGILVHNGKPTKDINWDSIIDDVREERIQSILGLS